MNRFVLRENLRRYRQMLDDASDPQARRELEALIRESEDELAFQERVWTWTCPHIAVPEALGATLERLLHRIIAAEGADSGSLQLWDARTESLRLLAHGGFDREAARRFAVVREGEGSACEAALIARRPIFVEDVMADGGWNARNAVDAGLSRRAFRRGLLDAVSRAARLRRGGPQAQRLACLPAVGTAGQD